MFRLVAAAAVLAAAVSCGGKGADIVVGSKNFTENLLLGELLAQHIEETTGLKVDRRLNLGGTFLCHQGLISGEIDVYPEYTGTALTAILKREVVDDPERVFEIVSEAYAAEFDAEWAAPFGFNNTFAIVVRSEDAEERGLRSISDLKALAGDWVIGFNFEFIERQDGFAGMIERYGLEFAHEPKTMDLGLLYRALRGGQIDIAVGNSTDGLISALNLRVLDDDRLYFPPYDAAAVVRRETLARHPELREALNQLGGLLSEQEMQRFNHEIDGEHRPVAEVAREIRRLKGLAPER